MFNIKRSISFSILAVIYAIAFTVGIFVFNWLSFSFELNLLIADVVATVVVFIFSLIFSNASVYDPYWSVQPIFILAAVSVSQVLNGGTVCISGILVLIAIFFWGVRLTANWAYTFRGLGFQDWRYTMLSEKCGKFYPVINFIGIHLVPTLVVFFCTLPAVEIIRIVPAIEIIRKEPVWNVFSIICFLISVFAFTIQGIADIQMHIFKKRKLAGKTKETFIRLGLWKHARHPNYFGEILMWWGVGLSAFCVMPGNYIFLLGALLNTCLFAFVSIPLAEGKQKTKSGYEEYKKETRVLI